MQNNGQVQFLQNVARRLGYENIVRTNDYRETFYNLTRRGSPDVYCSNEVMNAIREMRDFTQNDVDHLAAIIMRNNPRIFRNIAAGIPVIAPTRENFLQNVARRLGYENIVKTSDYRETFYTLTRRGSPDVHCSTEVIRALNNAQENFSQAEVDHLLNQIITQNPRIAFHPIMPVQQNIAVAPAAVPRPQPIQQLRVQNPAILVPQHNNVPQVELNITRGAQVPLNRQNIDAIPKNNATTNQQNHWQIMESKKEAQEVPQADKIRELIASDETTDMDRRHGTNLSTQQNQISIGAESTLAAKQRLSNLLIDMAKKNKGVQVDHIFADNIVISAMIGGNTLRYYIPTEDNTVRSQDGKPARSNDGKIPLRLTENATGVNVFYENAEDSLPVETTVNELQNLVDYLQGKLPELDLKINNITRQNNGAQKNK